MSIFELIGFVIVILALFAPLLRRLLEKRAEKKNPEEFARRRAEAEEKEKEALRQLLTQLGQEIPPELREHEPEPVPAPVSTLPEPPSQASDGVERTVPDSPPEQAYEFYQPQASSIQKLARSRSGRDMVLLREILEPPVSLR